MRTVAEFLKAEGCNFDVEPDGNGNYLYKNWSPASEAYEGRVVKLGKRYQVNMIIADANGEMIDTVPNPDGWRFIETADAWAEVFGLESTDGLIGLTTEEFYAEVIRRSEAAAQRN